MRKRDVRAGLRRIGDLKAAAAAVGASVRQVQRWAKGDSKPNPINDAKLRQYFRQNGYEPPPADYSTPLTGRDKTIAMLYKSVTGKEAFTPDDSYRNLQRMVRDAGGGAKGRRIVAEMIDRRPEQIKKWTHPDSAKRVTPNRESMRRITEHAPEIRALAAQKAARGRIAQLRRQPNRHLTVTVSGRGTAISGSPEHVRRRNNASLDISSETYARYLDALANGDEAAALRIINDAYNDDYIDGLGFRWDQIHDLKFR